MAFILEDVVVDEEDLVWAHWRHVTSKGIVNYFWLRQASSLEVLVVHRIEELSEVVLNALKYEIGRAIHPVERKRELPQRLVLENSGYDASLPKWNNE